MLKQLLTLFTLFFTIFQLQGQVIEPVKWSFKSNPTADGNYELYFSGKIEDGWYVYSQDIGEGGPVPTSFSFKENGEFEQIGEIKEMGNLIEKHDKMFDMMIKKYPKRLTFVATVKPLKTKSKVAGYFEFMTCDDMRCLPPEEVEFSFNLNKAVPSDQDLKQADPKTGGIKTGNKATAPNAVNSAANAVNSAANTASSQVEKTVEAAKSGVANEIIPSAAPQQAANNGQTNEISNDNQDTGILEPVKWAFSSESLGNDEHMLHFDAKVEKGWYVYSHDLEEGGPVPTNIEIDEDQGFKKVGKLVEVGKVKEAFDPMFEMQVKKYANKVRFSQKIKGSANSVKGFVDYMTCDDSKCLKEDAEFTINLAVGNAANRSAAASAVGAAAASKVKAGPEMFSSVIQECGLDAKNYGTDNKKGRTPWMIFILGFLGGFAALLTPCVFPMIPLTVSFFTKQSKTKKKGLINAFIYAVSIIVIYVALGFFVTVAFGPDFLNVLSTHPLFNLAFFVVFVIFAISFFGYFEITLPNSLINKSDSAADKGGLIGIFFMAFTLALVSFSCTGPIIGTLLVDAAVNGERLGPVVGMFGFALALSLPFALFAAFPGWLNSLPKSGGWLDVVKKVLGFIELIFALKFLSNADLVRQWGLVPREVFIGIWIVLLVAMGLYLFGKLRFKYDMKGAPISAARKVFGVLSFFLAALLLPGLLLKPIPLIGDVISGFPPPEFYNIKSSKIYGGGNDDGHDDENVGLHGIQDLEAGIAEAKKVGKPILLDFTGWACVNCRKMEENVWPKLEKLMEEYTLISLYVDEDIKLPKKEQFAYELNGKKKRVRTVGNKWSFLETDCFLTNTQPYYVLLNHEGEHLTAPKAYTPDVAEYENFLKSGVKNFKKGKTLMGK